MKRKTANNKKEIPIIVGSVIGAILLICGIGLIVLVGGVVSASRNTQRNINTYGEEFVREFKAARVGDEITFGEYEQDNDKYNGKEEIDWIVLAKSGDKMLVISKYALACEPYNETLADVTWETCTLRTWLNDEFMNDAFSQTEQELIQISNVKMDTNPHSGREVKKGKNTKDKLFLLSVTEAKKYFKSDSDRVCTITDYAESFSEYKSSENATYCWLRTPGFYQSEVAIIFDYGEIYLSGQYVQELGCYGWGDDPVEAAMGVRPAMWIELK